MAVTYGDDESDDAFCRILSILSDKWARAITWQGSDRGCLCASASAP